MGYYSYVVRGKRAKAKLELESEVAGKKEAEALAARLAPVADPATCDKRKGNSSWAAQIKRVFEVDPLLCPKCHNEMYIKSFILDPHEIAKVIKYAEEQPPEAEEYDSS